jgi:hypothetical protein
MTTTSEYPELDHFFGAYLNQDYELSGHTIEEVVRSYMQGTPPQAHRRMLDEIAKFSSAHPQDLDKALLARYGSDFDATLWEHTAASFFALVGSVLRGNGQAW